MDVERLAHRGGEHRPAAKRDRGAIDPLEQRDDDGRLAGSELRFAAAVEELGDRHPEVALDELVGVDGLEARGRGRPQRPRFPRAHEADEDEGPGPSP